VGGGSHSRIPEDIKANKHPFLDADFISQLIKRMEHAAEKRKRKTREEMQVSGQEDEPEDPYTKMARKARNLKDILHVGLTPLLRSKKTVTC
jgi:hypothetical protein